MRWGGRASERKRERERKRKKNEARLGSKSKKNTATVADSLCN